MNMNFKICAAAFLVLMFVAANLHASEKPKKLTAVEAESIEAAQEDDAEQTVDSETLKRLFEGKVMLYPAEATAERPEVIGIFRCGQTDYLIKLASPDLLQQLKELDGKQV